MQQQQWYQHGNSRVLECGLDILSKISGIIRLASCSDHLMTHDDGETIFLNRIPAAEEKSPTARPPELRYLRIPNPETLVNPAHSFHVLAQRQVGVTSVPVTPLQQGIHPSFLAWRQPLQHALCVQVGWLAF